jgi:hypothetical protein
MSSDAPRQKDILLLLFAVQLSLVAVIIPRAFPLFIISVMITLAVLVEEVVRRLDEYSKE